MHDMQQRSDYSSRFHSKSVYISGTPVVSTWEGLTDGNPGVNQETAKFRLYDILWKIGESGCFWQKMGAGLMETEGDVEQASPHPCCLSQ